MLYYDNSHNGVNIPILDYEKYPPKSKIIAFIVIKPFKKI